MCILLYDERVNTYRRMQEIDLILDEHTDMAAEMVDLHIRNQQAHQELQTYNDTKQFKYVHPLAIENQYREKQNNNLSQLLKENPDKFLQEITNTMQNIRRIKSDINKKKYKNEEQLQSWKENLEKAELKLKIMQGLITK